MRAVAGHRRDGLPCLTSSVCFLLLSVGAPFLRFNFTLNRVIILETRSAFRSTRKILQQNNIEFDRSKDLRDAQRREQAAVKAASISTSKSPASG